MSQVFYRVETGCQFNCQGCRAQSLIRGQEVSADQVYHMNLRLPEGKLADMVGTRITLRREQGCEAGVEVNVLEKEVAAVYDMYPAEGGARVPAPGYIVGGHDRRMAGFK